MIGKKMFKKYKKTPPTSQTLSLSPLWSRDLTLKPFVVGEMEM
jgi:hypothetical protein